ncbi:hypothetical protein RhiirA5_404908 [Rhizophagus irregularis]|uniref:Uncharacterized protein n=1 Tax=Rhizophagus irregularis TaxID=588596 RepID=A0A2N0NHK2_9GLOM|nr:hypothetical protein RhiirA5_404908 [Rhizophagus irregularis]
MQHFPQFPTIFQENGEFAFFEFWTMAPLRPVSITNLLQLSESEEEKYDSYEHLKSSDEDDDKDKTEQVFTSHSAKKNKPEALNGMKSVFEVCQWLITERTDILMIANQMYNAMNTSLDSSHVNMSTILMPKSATVYMKMKRRLLGFGMKK